MGLLDDLDKPSEPVFSVGAKAAAVPAPAMPPASPSFAGAQGASPGPSIARAADVGSAPVGLVPGDQPVTLDLLMEHVSREIIGHGMGHISDICLQTGSCPMFYTQRHWKRPSKQFLAPFAGRVLTKEEVEEMVSQIRQNNAERATVFASCNKDPDTLSSMVFNWPFGSGSQGEDRSTRWRVRAEVSPDINGQSLVLRVQPRRLPNLDELDVPVKELQSMIQMRSGLVLVCGPTGGGKSTTIVGMLKFYAEIEDAHIISLEDPVEYILEIPGAVITQKWVGFHVEDTETGIIKALREKADAIYIGELRDVGAVRAAARAAQSGHLVIASTHHTEAAQVVEYLVRMTPDVGEQAVLRESILGSLAGIVCQNLVPGKVAGKNKVVPVFEVVPSCEAIKAAYATARLPDIRAAINDPANGCLTWEARLKDLLSNRVIGQEVFQRFSRKY
jgi:Tfp pilus assembly pilus retraction ATPase PilT